MLAFIYKLGMCAEQRWQRMPGIKHLPEMITGIHFNDGIEVNETSRSAV
jgi:putative transposase